VYKKKRVLYLLTISLIIVFTISFVITQKANTARSTLYWGMRNNDVGILQRKLKQWGYYDGGIDYIYGKETWLAVKEFQRKNNLRDDGIVGASTWGALGYTSNSAVTTLASGSVSRNDKVHLVARLIHAEARGEPYVGQVAVGAVLLNRVEDPAFPNSISGVIYQPLAFESVANGQFDLPPTSENIRAAQAALNGWDPVYGATFFWNPSKPVNEWIWSRESVKTIGSHIFAY